MTKPKKGETQKYLDYLIQKWKDILGLGQWLLIAEFKPGSFFKDNLKKEFTRARNDYSVHDNLSYIYIRKFKGEEKSWGIEKDYKYCHNIERRVIHEMLHLIVMTGDNDSPWIIDVASLDEMEASVRRLTTVLFKLKGEEK